MLKIIIIFLFIYFIFMTQNVKLQTVFRLGCHDVLKQIQLAAYFKSRQLQTYIFYSHYYFGGKT